MTARTADPVADAAAHIDTEMERWERLRAESVCRDCLYCAVPSGRWFANPGRIAYCTHYEVRDFTHWTDGVAELGCDWFEPLSGGWS